MILSVRVDDDLFSRAEAKMRLQGLNPEGKTDVIVYALQQYLGPTPPENKPLEQPTQQSAQPKPKAVWENGHWVVTQPTQPEQEQLTASPEQTGITQADPTVNRWMKQYLERDAIEEAKFQANLKRLKQVQDTKLEFEEAKARLRKQERREGHGQGRSGQIEEPHGATFFFGEGA